MTVSCVAVTCDTLESVTDYQSTIDLSNLNRSVFTDCPEALNADNYNASQISVIAQQALNVSVHCILIVLRTIASILYFVLSICMSCICFYIIQPTGCNIIINKRSKKNPRINKPSDCRYIILENRLPSVGLVMCFVFCSFCIFCASIQLLC